MNPIVARRPVRTNCASDKDGLSRATSAAAATVSHTGTPGNRTFITVIETKKTGE